MTKSEHSKELNEPKESTTPEKKKKKSRWPKRLGYGALVVVGILVVAVGTEVVGYYRYNFDDPFTTRTVTILPFPAATVAKRIITVNSVMENERALTQFFKTDRNLDLADAENREAKQDVRKSILDRMIEDVVVRELAIQNNIVVTDADVQKQVDEIKSQISEGQNLNDALQQLYGWDEQEFVNRVVRPQAQLAKLQELYNNNDTLTGDARKKAEDVLAKVKEPNADFAALAKEFSEDTGSASAGGDLGTVGSGVFVPEFEDAAKALEPGQISEIVRTSFGFHIIKLVAKDDKTFHAQHILIKTDFQGWLDDQKRTFDIRVPLEDFAWDKETAAVTIVDLDRDGKPDAQDDDDDNDGFADSEEQAANSDPLNHSSVPQSDNAEEQTQETGSGTTTDGAAQ